MAGFLEGLGMYGGKGVQGRVDRAVNGAQGINPEAAAILQQQQEQQMMQQNVQKAYNQQQANMAEQQAIEASPEFQNKLLDYYQKNPGQIQYEKDAGVLEMLQQNGIGPKKSSGWFN